MDITNGIILLPFLYFGLVITRYIILYLVLKDRGNINWNYLLIPYSVFNFEKFYSSKKLKINFRRITIILCEVFGTISAYLLSLVLYYVITVLWYSAIESLLIITLATFFYISMLYLSINDILFLKLPLRIVYNFLISIFTINLAIGIFKFIYYRNTGDIFLNNVQIGEIGNLFAAVLIGIIIYLIRKLSKNKAIGEGDLEMLIAFALMLGWPNTFLALLVAVVSGLVVGLLFKLTSKKDWRFKIPFAPFILFGYIIALGIGHLVWQILI
jgi:prepilin signal peptidase PulO-like enzyme (type II secretory pathway)